MKDPRQNHRIHVVLDGQDYGMRMWASVPRVGDHMLLKESKKENSFFTVLVTQVTWGVAVDDYMTTWPDVNLHVTRKK